VEASSLTHAEAVIAEADALLAAGRGPEAIDLLDRAVRSGPDAPVDAPDPALLRRLVTARHQAFAQRPPTAEVDFTPPTAADHGGGALPELARDDLTAASLRAGMARNGCVLVRNLVDVDRALELAAGVDRALAAFDDATERGADHDDEGWYAHFTPTPGAYRVGGRRNWVRATGAMWTADSPRMLAMLLDVVRDTGVGVTIAEYLGERPALSANKCTLRRVPLTTSTGWHQDGAFLGAHVRTVNLWLALGNCGRTAPGMDVVTRRVDRVVETGTEGAMLDWTIAPDVVERTAGEVGISRPEFGPGDALLFDHLLLHSTAVDPGMTDERHAMETWFFGPSAYPDGQIPLLY
jgi:hypothetical protein